MRPSNYFLGYLEIRRNLFKVYAFMMRQFSGRFPIIMWLLEIKKLTVPNWEIESRLTFKGS